MSSSIVQGYTLKCVASEPVFSLSSDYGDIRAAVCHHADQPVDPSDSISVMVADSFRERFIPRERRFEVDHYGIARDVTSQIVGRVQKFYENNSGLKKPRTSKLYKWLCYLDGNAEDAVVMVYRYLTTFCNHEMQPNAAQDPNVENAIAVLEHLRSKYEK